MCDRLAEKVSEAVEVPVLQSRKVARQINWEKSSGSLARVWLLRSSFAASTSMRLRAQRIKWHLSEQQATGEVVNDILRGSR